MMRLIIVTILCFNLSIIPAQAKDLYIGVSLGVSQFDGTADTDANQFGSINSVPAEISINGLPFESTETSWSAYAGWQIKSWIALEVGFSDLGNSGRENPVFFASNGAVLSSGTSLNVEELYLGTKFSAPLSPAISANWIVGVTRSDFDTDGFLPILTGSGFFDAAIERIPFASPGSETGIIWGFGFNWKVNERIALGVDYRQHNTPVLDIDSLTFGVAVSI